MTVDPSQPTAVPASDGRAQPHAGPYAEAAVIWLGGLGAQKVDQGLEAIAKRIAFACDRRAAAEATFAVRASLRPEGLPSGLAIARCSVLRTDVEGSPPILDLYEFPASTMLIGDRGQKPLPRQFVFAFRAVLSVIPKAWRTRKLGLGKTRRERWQLLYARVALIVMIAALVILLGLLAGSVAVADLPPGLRFLDAVIVGFGGLSLWKSAFAKRLGAGALVGYSVVDYLNRGDEVRSQLRGQLVELLEHFAEQQRHQSIDVVAYSFGSIVAVDTLFPDASNPPPRLETVNRLITIACPFDFVRSYWTDYFTRRYSRAGAPGQWINIYAPSDVLASNFRDDEAIDGAVDGITVRDGQPAPLEPENKVYPLRGLDGPVSGWDFLFLQGLRVHGQYWSSRVASEEGVFDEVIKHVGQPIPP